jgi:flagellar hook-length control protein FliK
MIEINAATGLIGKEGPQASRQSSPGNFRNFLESLGAAPERQKMPVARPVQERPASASPRDIREMPMPRSPRETIRSQAREILDASELDRPTTDVPTKGKSEGLNQASEPVMRKSAEPSKAQGEELEAVLEEPSQEEDSEPLSWQDQVELMLGSLGLHVDASKLADLSAQDMRELNIALRAGLKGIAEGQSLSQVSQLVGELLPISLQGPQLAVTSGAGDVGNSTSVPSENIVLDPVREHMATEIGRLAEVMVDLTKPVKAEDAKAGSVKLTVATGMLEFATSMEQLAKEETPVLPVVQASATNQTQQQTTPSPMLAAAPTLMQKEDPSAFLRMDATAWQIQRTDLQATEAAQAKAAAHFRPSGPAGEILAHQVYDEFQLRPGMDHREMVLKLWPRELGQVSVHIRMGENDRVEAKIMVQSENVRQALLEHTPVLRETLAKQGLELGNLSVSVGGGNTPSHDQDARDQSRRHRSGRGWENGLMESTAMVEAGSDTGRRNGFNSIDVLT